MCVPKASNSASKPFLRCVAEGLSVFQQDIDTGLSEYADNSFDYVILNQTLQQVKKPDFSPARSPASRQKNHRRHPKLCPLQSESKHILQRASSRHAALPFQWYDTPNLHFLSINDFKEYCKKKKSGLNSSFFKSGNKQSEFFAEPVC